MKGHCLFAFNQKEANGVTVSRRRNSRDFKEMVACVAGATRGGEGQGESPLCIRL